MPFLTGFLKAAGLFDAFVAASPLHYPSPDAPVEFERRNSGSERPGPLRPRIYATFLNFAASSEPPVAFPAL
jgi:hypothetical protein